MKKIYYLIAFIAVAAGFTACNPMNETYKQLDASPTASPKTLTYTLLSADYSLGNTGNKTGYFTSATDANTNIPKILNAKFPYGYDNGSNATITYATPPTTVKLADSTFTDVAYTLTTADYKLLPNNTFTDFSATQILSWLPYKYTTPAANQLAVLTYNYYEGGVTSSSGTPTTDSFLYLNGAWTKIYTVSAAQYASVNRGTSNQFTPTDAANIPSYVNTFLKADQTVATVAKPGDVKYVSYKYYATSKLTYQRVQVLTFDGTNWVTSVTATNSLKFVKSNGAWVQDPTIYYTTVAKDYVLIGNTPSTSLAGATTTAISNYAQYGDFNTQSTSTYYWTPAQIDAALIVLLKSNFPTPSVGIPYHLNYLVYSGTTTTTFETFKFDGTNWIKQ